jgi:chromosome segregation ATPase
MRSAGFARSTPVALRSFSDLLTVRSSEAADLAADEAAALGSRRPELRQQLESLVYEINTVQSQLTSDQRNYLTDRERLVTELTRQRVAEELKAHESRVAHAAALQQLRDAHSQSVAQFASTPPDVAPSSWRRAPNASLREAAQTLQSFEHSLSELRCAPGELTTAADSVVMDEQICKVAARKAELTSATNTAEAASRKQLMELVLQLDDQTYKHQQEIAAIQNANDQKEKQFCAELDRVVAKIAHIQAERSRSDEQQQQRIAKLHEEIESVGAGFKEKMRNAARVAARLQTQLEQSKLRKDQKLRSELERAGERGKLIQENSAVKLRIWRLEAEIRMAKVHLAAVRKEARVVIGPRRTASLFV